ncbi:ABC transporter permease [Massilia sp. R2A-15]|uniref:ABC transporter permease n=1 Tax=Massilia sp. R2A-15 TaxID=3064278 RepID=UPI0027353C16|nr:ABC transporter permease [Massilia sp. R2A-15]WLI89711.1 ABC transporter permease [Massilia sp. R2A-15]
MTAFLALVRKDLILFLSDRRALLVNLVLPILIATFFGYLFGGPGPAKGGAIDVALVQQDSGEIGAKIVAALKADTTLRITDMSADQAREAVGRGKQKAAIIIPPGFGEAAGSALFGSGEKPRIDVLYDPSQQAVLAMVKGLLTQQVMQVVSSEMFGGKAGKAFTDKSIKQLEQAAGADPSLKDFLGSLQKFQARPEVQRTGGKAGGLSMPFTTSDQQVSLGPKEAGYNGYAHSFAGMGVQFILFLGVNMGIEILQARRSGIWNRLLAAPVTLTTVLLARAASGAIISVALLCVMFAFAAGVFGVHITNLAGFLGVAVCFGLLTASFGLLIAAYGKTAEAARGIAVFATLIMVMLGGAWVPSFMFPGWVQKVTVAVPTRWAIDGLDAMTWRGLGMDAAGTAMAAELGFALLFAVLALTKFKREHR